jgi:hypothetical protein
MGFRTIDLSDKAVTPRKVDQCIVVMTGPATENLEGSVSHSLGRVPQGYYVVWQNKAGDLYRGTKSTAWTSTTFYAHFSAASMVVHVALF